MPKVALIKCPDYLDSNVEKAVSSIFDLLDLKSLIKPGQKVLLKPNLLASLRPEKGATTHPSVVKAIAKKVEELGAHPYIGDSPGGVGVMYESVLKATGMKEIGYPIVNFEQKGMRKFPNPKGTVDPLYLANEALDAELIINIPKLKTHELTLLSCGIKNMFGCVPGLNKITYHLEAQKPEDFAEALIDMFSHVVPGVTIVDAVVSMEGQGPSHGQLRDSKHIIASKDTVALDAICAMLMGFGPNDILTTNIAAERGLGTNRLEDIELVGEKLEPITNFKKPSGISSFINRMPRPFLYILKPIIDRIKVKPRINDKICVKCMMCVRSCPTKAIDPKTFKIDHKKCIMCFCCRELCKYNAVELEKSILWQILNPGGK